MPTKPSSQQAGISVDRGRWCMEWDSESEREYIIHDAVTGQEFKLRYEDVRDLRYCLGVVGEALVRDLKLRQSPEDKE